MKGNYIVYILFMLVLLTIFIMDKNNKVIENFPWHYRPIHYIPIGMNSYHRMDYVPPIILPPHYGDLGIRDFNKLNKFPINNNSSYCKLNPYCYPCPGWVFIGPPNCI